MPAKKPDSRQPNRGATPPSVETSANGLNETTCTLPLWPNTANDVFELNSDFEFWGGNYLNPAVGAIDPSLTFVDLEFGPESMKQTESLFGPFFAGWTRPHNVFSPFRPLVFAAKDEGTYGNPYTYSGFDKQNAESSPESYGAYSGGNDEPSTPEELIEHYRRMRDFVVPYTEEVMGEALTMEVAELGPMARRSRRRRERKANNKVPHFMRAFNSALAVLNQHQNCVPPGYYAWELIYPQQLPTQSLPPGTTGVSSDPSSDSQKKSRKTAEAKNATAKTDRYIDPNGHDGSQSVAPPFPIYNVFCKYVVKLFFGGAYRKIIVDDRVPVDSNNDPLFTVTTQKEIWPLLLFKAMLKVLLQARQERLLFTDPNFILSVLLGGYLPEVVENLEFHNLLRFNDFLQKFMQNPKKWIITLQADPLKAEDNGFTSDLKASAQFRNKLGNSLKTILSGNFSGNDEESDTHIGQKAVEELWPQLYNVMDAREYRGILLVRICGICANWTGRFAYCHETWTPELEDSICFVSRKMRNKFELRKNWTDFWISWDDLVEVFSKAALFHPVLTYKHFQQITPVPRSIADREDRMSAKKGVKGKESGKNKTNSADSKISSSAITPGEQQILPQTELIEVRSIVRWIRVDYRPTHQPKIEAQSLNGLPLSSSSNLQQQESITNQSALQNWQTDDYIVITFLGLPAAPSCPFSFSVDSYVWDSNVPFMCCAKNANPYWEHYTAYVVPLNIGANIFRLTLKGLQSGCSISIFSPVQLQLRSGNDILQSAFIYTMTDAGIILPQKPRTTMLWFKRHFKVPEDATSGLVVNFVLEVLPNYKDGSQYKLKSLIDSTVGSATSTKGGKGGKEEAGRGATAKKGSGGAPSSPGASQQQNYTEDSVEDKVKFIRADLEQDGILKSAEDMKDDQWDIFKYTILCTVNCDTGAVKTSVLNKIMRLTLKKNEKGYVVMAYSTPCNEEEAALLEKTIDPRIYRRFLNIPEPSESGSAGSGKGKKDDKKRAALAEAQQQALPEVYLGRQWRLRITSQGKPVEAFSVRHCEHMLTVQGTSPQNDYGILFHLNLDVAEPCTATINVCVEGIPDYVEYSVQLIKSPSKAEIDEIISGSAATIVDERKKKKGPRRYIFEDVDLVPQPDSTFQLIGRLEKAYTISMGNIRKEIVESQYRSLRDTKEKQYMDLVEECILNPIVEASGSLRAAVLDPPVTVDETATALKGQKGGQKHGSEKVLSKEKELYGGSPPRSAGLPPAANGVYVRSPEALLPDSLTTETSSLVATHDFNCIAQSNMSFRVDCFSSSARLSLSKNTAVNDNAVAVKKSWARRPEMLASEDQTNKSAQEDSRKASAAPPKKTPSGKGGKQVDESAFLEEEQSREQNANKARCRYFANPTGVFVPIMKSDTNNYDTVSGLLSEAPPEREVFSLENNKASVGSSKTSISRQVSLSADQMKNLRSSSANRADYKPFYYEGNEPSISRDLSWFKSAKEPRVMDPSDISTEAAEESAAANCLCEAEGGRQKSASPRSRAGGKGGESEDSPEMFEDKLYKKLKMLLDTPLKDGGILIESCPDLQERHKNAITEMLDTTCQFVSRYRDARKDIFEKMNSIMYECQGLPVITHAEFEREAEELVKKTKGKKK